ncbi:VOC family protein [Cellulomonas sp. Leaf334]|uniref:VOC family protein n=1 Tax=Cellulomonas sp. Leaf334 TaxID=1736339 RepID=UPI0006FEAD35|nr:VOC family protein [Cellulomonas sp. Leaf334]KQR11818.1 glyoxalase [Cellulomonas sp. Leaf334]
MITSIYPVLMSTDVAATTAFFRDAFALETVFESDWYVSLRSGAFELAVLDASHDSIPAGYRTPATGILVNIEVEDVDAEHERLVTRGGAPVAQELRSETFGQRHVILVAPGGVLVDVIQPIPITDPALLAD